MAAKPQVLEETVTPQELMFVAVPAEVYKQLSDACSRRGMTFAQGFGKMVGDFLAETPVVEEED